MDDRIYHWISSCGWFYNSS